MRKVGNSKKEDRELYGVTKYSGPFQSKYAHPTTKKPVAYCSGTCDKVSLIEIREHTCRGGRGLERKAAKKFCLRILLWSTVVEIVYYYAVNEADVTKLAKKVFANFAKVFPGDPKGTAWITLRKKKLIAIYKRGVRMDENGIAMRDVRSPESELFDNICN